MIRSLNTPDHIAGDGIDNAIKSLRILAFDVQSGTCMSNTLYADAALTGTTLSHPILQGKYHFVFLTNEPPLTAVKARLNAIAKYDDIKGIDYPAISFDSDSYIPMIAQNKNVEVLADGNIVVENSNRTVLDLKLRRLAARVDVVLKSTVDLGDASTGTFKGVTFSNLPDKVPLVWGLPSSPMGSSWVYAEPDLNYTETAVTRNTVRKFTLANDGSYFNIDPSLLSQEEINNGLVWAASVSRVIIPACYFSEEDSESDAIIFTVNLVDRYSPSCLLKILSDPDYRLPANTRLDLTGIIKDPLEMNITVKGWDEVKNDWETEQLYLNVSQSEVNITDFNGARVTFESNAKVVRVSGMYDTSGTFKEYVADGFNQLQWGEDWNKKWNYTYDAVAKVGKGYLDIIVNNGAQTTGTYHIVLKATRKESWEGVNTLSLSRSIKVNVVQEGKRYGFEPSTAASAYVGSSYIGAFYRNKEVGERIIQNTFWGSWWEATVPNVDIPDSGNPKDWIRVSPTPSFDPTVGTSNPGEAEYYPVAPNYYRNETGLKVTGTHRIYFRVGLTSANQGSSPRYGYVNLRYITGTLANMASPPGESDTYATTTNGPEEIKTLRIYVRQGEADDYVLDTSIDVANNTSVSRDAAAICRFSPFNITVQDMLTYYTDRTENFVQVVDRGTTFVKYPSQAGALFQWGVPTEKYRKYAYYIRGLDDNEFLNIDPTIPNEVWGGNHKYDYDPFWIAPAGHEYPSFEAYGEVCPPGYRRPNNGVLSALAKNNTIQEVVKSEYMASLFREIPVGDSHQYIPSTYPNDANAPNGIVRYVPKAVSNVQYGFYADGFFDRYPIHEKALPDGNVDGICLDDTRAAFRGTLFFNPVTYASIFFPAGGRRAATSGRLQYNGGTGFYLTSSLGNQWIDPDANYSFRNVWQMELSNFPGALSAVPGFGVSLRCVVDE